MVSMTQAGDLPHDTLWCINENSDFSEVSLFPGNVLTNRYDIYQHLTAQDITCYFSDFSFSEIPNPERFTQLHFHIAKEKAVNLHIIKSFFHYFQPESTLIMIGLKQEGILSLIKFIQEQGIPVRVQRHKNKQIEATISYIESAIPQSDYAHMQTLRDTDILCKGGVYGFNKIDKGSALLIDMLTQYTHDNSLKLSALSLLDLGCGYGYLSVMAHKLGFSSIDATDNCAGAINTCQANFSQWKIQGEVIADDCGRNIKKQYDWVLCNPPFHQGFDHSKSLIEHFIKSASDRLKKGGNALFVVNQFIGIEKIAKNHFTNCTLLVKNDGYKILHLER